MSGNCSETTLFASVLAGFLMLLFISLDLERGLFKKGQG